MASGQGSGGLGCGASLARLILFVVNICFWVGGVAILAVGIWVKVDPAAFRFLQIVAVDQKSPLINAAVWILIAVGIFVFVIGFLGCCGAWKKNTCMLWTYGSLLLLVLLLQITAGIVAGVFSSKLGRDLQNTMKQQIKESYGKTPNDGLTVAWDFMQWEFQCCGGENYKDYANSTYVKQNTNITVSTFCCKKCNTDFDHPQFKNVSMCQSDAKNQSLTQGTESLNTQGCYDGLLSWMKKRTTALIVVGVIIAGVEIVAIVFACCLKNAIKAEVEMG